LLPDAYYAAVAAGSPDWDELVGVEWAPLFVAATEVLADEQIADAKRAVADGDNERATYLLLRARADAELALALAHEQNAITEKEKAIAQSAVTLEANKPGATP
jgi:hypothetical protein